MLPDSGVPGSAIRKGLKCAKNVADVYSYARGSDECSDLLHDLENPPHTTEVN